MARPLDVDRKLLELLVCPLTKTRLTLSTDGRELTVSYKGGNKVIEVPDNTPVVTYIGATHADVVAGRKIFVIATANGPGHYKAERVTVEKDGVVPPM